MTRTLPVRTTVAAIAMLTIVALPFISGKAVMVPVASARIESLGKKYPFYTVATIPPNTYKGQEREVTTPAVMAMLAPRTDLPDDLVYKFTKAIFDNLPQFHAAHSAAKSLTIASRMPIPLHAGADRFFKEKGVAR